MYAISAETRSPSFWRLYPRSPNVVESRSPSTTALEKQGTASAYRPAFE
jgi:hypothetical protein